MGEAEELLKTIPFLDRSITTELVGLNGSGDKLGVVRTKRYYDFLGDLRQTDGNALGARVIIQKNDGKPVVSRIGGAIFTNWRLAGWLNPDEMQEANWILRQNPHAVVSAFEFTSMLMIRKPNWWIGLMTAPGVGGLATLLLYYSTKFLGIDYLLL